MKWILFICLGLFLSGCSSIPIRTALEFGSFDEVDFANLEPKDIRVKVITVSNVKVKPTANTMQITVDSNDRTIPFSFKIEPIEYRVLAKEEGLFSDTPERNQTLLKLDSESISEFRLFQKEIQQNGFQPKSIDIPFDLEFDSSKPDSANVSILIKLNRVDHFITLIDNYEVR